MTEYPSGQGRDSDWNHRSYASGEQYPDEQYPGEQYYGPGSPGSSRAGSGGSGYGDSAQGGSGYRIPPSLVQRADGQVVQLTPLLYRLLCAVDGSRTEDEIAAVVSSQVGRAVVAEDVHTLVEQKLRPLGVLKCADGSEPAVRKANPLLALRFRVVVSDPGRTRRLTAPFAMLFHPAAVVAVTACFAAVAY